MVYVLIKLLEVIVLIVGAYLIYKGLKVESSHQYKIDEEKKRKIKRYWRSIGILLVIALVLRTLLDVGYVLVLKAHYSPIIYISISRVIFVAVMIVSIILIINKNKKAEKINY